MRFLRGAIRKKGLDLVDTVCLNHCIERFLSSIGFGGWLDFFLLVIYNRFSHILVPANTGNQDRKSRLLEIDQHFMVSKMKYLNV